MNILAGMQVFESNKAVGVPCRSFLRLRARLVAAAEKLLADPRDVKERAKLEVLVAREVYGLVAGDWQHLTGTFTFGGGASKAELDQVIALSRAAF